MPELAFPSAATALKKLHHGLVVCIKNWTQQDPAERPLAQMCLDDLTVLSHAGPLSNPASTQPVTQLVSPVQPRLGLGPRSTGTFLGQMLIGVSSIFVLVLGLFLVMSTTSGWLLSHNRHRRRGNEKTKQDTRNHKQSSAAHYPLHRICPE
jgi:hypothetical protein